MVTPSGTWNEMNHLHKAVHRHQDGTIGTRKWKVHEIHEN
jgi:hypothetical protein